jgi:hypothetical protein
MMSRCKYGWMSVNCGTTSIAPTMAMPVAEGGMDAMTPRRGGTRNGDIKPQQREAHFL